MGKIEYLFLNFTKKNAIYFPGEVVHGTLNYKLSERLKVNQVKLVAQGDSLVHWTDNTYSGRNRISRTHKAYEKYFKYEIVFISKSTPPTPHHHENQLATTPDNDSKGANNNNNNGNNDDTHMLLEAGEHSHSFQIHLPSNLPTSFEHPNGRVRYWCAATINMPWSFDRTATRAFTVLNHYDLNHFSSLADACSLSESRVLCCLCCKSPPIKATLDLEKLGFVPGESIICSVTIENPTSREFDSPLLSLTLKVKLHASNKTKIISKCVASTKLSGRRVRAKQVEKYEQVKLAIPCLCSTSSSSYCKILEVGYILNLNLDLSGSSENVHLHLPIVVGTIPIRDNHNVLMMPTTPGSKEEPYFTFQEEEQQQISEQTTFSTTDSPKTKDTVVENSNINFFKPIYPFYKIVSIPKMESNSSPVK